MIDFERAFDDLEKAADSALEAAKELEKQAKTFKRLLRAGISTQSKSLVQNLILR